MKLTPEQLEIIMSTGDIKINAVAGSGKTTTVIEYAKARPKNSRILYLAFNKSVKLEATKKFAEKGLNNVRVETAHSLAYRYIVFQNNYKIRSQGYKTHEIAEILNLEGNGEKHTEYVIANHINKFIAYFCNSDKLRVKDLNYLETVTDPKAKVFVKSFYNYIEAQSRLFLSKMDKGIIEITHDFYLKKFQLSNPVLPFDYILFDEGQDASPAMLDVFLNQNCTKVIVGDTHQQIYGWRFAVNSLEKANFKTYHLSTSFRFNQDIANMAMEVLNFKKHIGPFQPIEIKGKGTNKEKKTTAILARTNLGLLLKAIEFISEKNNVKHIYFEGNINSYTYADEGASLYDVLNLYNHKSTSIKDKLISSMKSMNELEDYIEKTEDVQLGMMVEIVKEYGNEIYDLIKKIKEKHVENDEKHKAEMIFSTVHRCKGMEYDEIHLVNDFMTEEKLEKLMDSKKAEEINEAKLNEEVNLLYVAVTRTKNKIHIPDNLIPFAFPASNHIHPVKTLSKDDIIKSKIDSRQFKLPLINTKKRWTMEHDEDLTDLFCEGEDLDTMAKLLGRTKSEVGYRIKKLALEKLYGYG